MMQIWKLNEEILRRVRLYKATNAVVFGEC